MSCGVLSWLLGFLVSLLPKVSNGAFCEELCDCPDEQALVSKLMKHRAKR